MTAFFIAAAFNLHWILAYPETVRESVTMKSKLMGFYWYTYNSFAICCLVRAIWK